MKMSSPLLWRILHHSLCIASGNFVYVNTASRWLCHCSRGYTSSLVAFLSLVLALYILALSLWLTCTNFAMIVFHPFCLNDGWFRCWRCLVQLQSLEQQETYHTVQIARATSVLAVSRFITFATVWLFLSYSFYSFQSQALFKTFYIEMSFIFSKD